MFSVWSHLYEQTIGNILQSLSPLVLQSIHESMNSWISEAMALGCVVPLHSPCGFDMFPQVSAGHKPCMYWSTCIRVWQGPDVAGCWQVTLNALVQCTLVLILLSITIQGFYIWGQLFSHFPWTVKKHCCLIWRYIRKICLFGNFLPEWFVSRKCNYY